MFIKSTSTLMILSVLFIIPTLVLHSSLLAEAKSISLKKFEVKSNEIFNNDLRRLLVKRSDRRVKNEPRRVVKKDLMDCTTLQECKQLFIDIINQNILNDQLPKLRVNYHKKQHHHQKQTQQAVHRFLDEFLDDVSSSPQYYPNGEIIKKPFKYGRK